MIHTDSKTEACLLNPWRNEVSRIWNAFSLLLNVSCRDLALAKNFFTSLESPSFVTETLSGSPWYPVSPMTLFPSGILKKSAFWFFGLVFFSTPEDCNIMYACTVRAADPKNIITTDGNGDLITNTRAIKLV